MKLLHSNIISYQGTVYHYYNNTWAILCDEGWNLQSANVVCKQLGLGKAINSSTSDFSSISMKNFLLTNTNCNGKEEFLKDCMLTGNQWEIVQTCPGSYVAEVICEGKVHDDNVIQCVVYCVGVVLGLHFAMGFSTSTS